MIDVDSLVPLIPVWTFVMSNKLSSDGKFLPFRGWTVISPVRPSARPYGAALDESQAVWSSLLYSALHMIRTSSCASNFACLPEESLHTTITGLTDQQVGVKPADLRVRQRCRLFPSFQPFSSFLCQH